jgi:hypothetical protein
MIDCSLMALSHLVFIQTIIVPSSAGTYVCVPVLGRDV